MNKSSLLKSEIFYVFGFENDCHEQKVDSKLLKVNAKRIVWTIL